MNYILILSILLVFSIDNSNAEKKNRNGLKSSIQAHYDRLNFVEKPFDFSNVSDGQTVYYKINKNLDGKLFKYFIDYLCDE
jgi:hypothetical protein